MNNDQGYSSIKPSQKQETTSSSNTCLSCWCWTIQILVWASLLLGIASIFLQTVELLGVFAFCYIVYIITEFCSPTFSYLIHRKVNDKMYEKMGVLFQTPPTITFTAQCYHYETRHYTEKDADGKTRHRTSTERINTHWETMDVPYYSTKDVSGLFLLNVQGAVDKNKMFIKLHLQKEINFADAISYSDYIVHKEAFWRRNRYRDVHMDFHEYRNIKGFHEYNLVQIGDNVPGCFGTCFYVLWTFIPFCEIYKRYVDSFCIEQNFKIRKLISTRYNLMAQEYAQQYYAFSPALNLYSQMYNYDSANTGYCYSSANVMQPTQEELQNAQQYNSQIPNYTYSTVEGGEIGIVQDIPTFEEVNYDVPPPSFVSIGGDVQLPNDQINSEGNNGQTGNNNMYINPQYEEGGFQSGNLYQPPGEFGQNVQVGPVVPVVP